MVVSEEMSEIRVNYDLYDRVQKAREKLVNDDSYKIWERDLEKEEADHLKAIGEMCESLSASDYAAIVTVAVKNYPEIVLKAVLDELQELKEGENNGRAKNDT